MSEETPNQPSVSIKVGASIVTLRGTLAQIRKGLVEVTGLTSAETKDPRTLMELVVEADIHATGLWTAASMIGFQSSGGAEQTDQPPKGTTTEQYRQSIADKAAAEGQPENYTDDITALIAGATSQQGLTDIRDANKDTWNEAHRAAAAKRWNEIGE